MSGTKGARLELMFATLAMVVSSIATVLLLKLAIGVISSRLAPNWRHLAAFVALAGTSILCRMLSANLANRGWLSRLHQYRLELLQSILHAPLQLSERIGRNRLMTALNADATARFMALGNLPGMLGNGVIVVGVAIYLMLLSPAATVTCLTVLFAGVAVHRGILARAGEHVRRARQRRDQLTRIYARTIGSLRELILNVGLARDTLRLDVAASSERFSDAELHSRRLFALSQASSQMITFTTLLIVLFLIPGLGAVEPRDFATFALMVLYLHGPIEFLLDGLSNLTNAKVARERLEGLRLPASPGLAPPGPVSPGLASATLAAPQPAQDFREIAFEDVRFGYADETRAPGFALLAINLRLRPGEVVLLSGSNGSGKTTLVKLIAGLYAPQAGRVLLDGKPVAGAGITAYRALFSVIFADTQRLPRLPRSHHSPDRIQSWLGQLGLGGHVTIEDGVLSEHANLSTGQIARVALLSMLLEDRPVVVFDEWAASQDADFRAFFFNDVLPRLKNDGKLVLLINHQPHDTEQPEVIDRVLVLRGGTVTEQTMGRVAPMVLPAAAPCDQPLLSIAPGGQP